MSRVRTPILILAFLSLCLAFWNVKVQSLPVPPDIPKCQDLGVDYYNHVTLVENVVPLEQGACTSGDDNLLIKLPQGPQDSLDALQYPQNNPQPNDVMKSIIGPAAGVIFGTSDMCVNLEEDKIIYGYQQGGKLNALRCVSDATTLCLNNNRFQVTTEWEDFSTVRTVKDPTDPGNAYIAGRNDDTNQILGFSTQDGVLWSQGFTIDDVSGATDGATRFAGGLQNGNYYALYSSTDPNEYEVELFDTGTGVDRVVDKDLRGGPLKESCCRSVPGTGHIYCAWYNARDNMVSVLGKDIWRFN